MKNLSLSLLLALLASTAIASDKAGDPCPQTGYHTAQFGNKVLSCFEGKWESVGNVGSSQFTLTVQLMEGDKRLTSATVTTMDGQPTPISIGSEYSYVAEARKDGDKVILTPGVIKDGLFMMMTPTLVKGGKIAVEFAAKKSEITAIQNCKQGDLEIQLPHVRTVDLKQKLVLENGNEVEIPFGPLLEPMKNVEMGNHPRTQYTVKLVATLLPAALDSVKR